MFNKYTRDDFDIPMLSQARKDIDVGTGGPFDADNPDHISEWAMAFGLSLFKSKQEFTEEEFYEAVKLGTCQQIIDGLCEKGIMESYWDEEQQTICYICTDLGKKVADKLRDKNNTL